MGQKYLVGVKGNRTIQIPFGKYTILGEKAEIKPEDVKKIGDALGVDWNSTDATQLYEGTKLEAKEHIDIVGSNTEKAVRIALAHLKEIPDYYTRLKAMEQETEEKIPNTDANIRNADEDITKQEEGRWITRFGRRMFLKPKEPEKLEAEVKFGEKGSKVKIKDSGKGEVAVRRGKTTISAK